MVVASAHAWNRYLVILDMQGVAYCVGDPKNPMAILIFSNNHYQPIPDIQANGPCKQMLEIADVAPMFKNEDRNRLKGGALRDPALCVHDSEYDQHWLKGECTQDNVMTNPRLMVANLTSMRTNLDAALEHDPTILVVSETKLCPTTTRSTTKMLAARGYTMIAACGPFSGDRHSQRSGVAIIVKQPYSVIAAEVAELPSDPVQWQSEGRLLIGHLLDPDGCRIAAIAAVYSDVRVRESQASATSVSQLCQFLQQWSAMQGRMPTFIAGDFNLCPSELPAFDCLCDGTNLVDINKVMEAYPRIPTTKVSERAIDYVLANPAGCERVTHVHTLTTSRIPVHHPVLCTLTLTPLPKRHRLNLPRELVPMTRPNNADGDQWQDGAVQFEDAIQAHDVDAALMAWSTRWENFLRYHTMQQGQSVQASHLGRGRERSWRPWLSHPGLVAGGPLFDSYAARKISNLMTDVATVIKDGYHNATAAVMMRIRQRLSLLGWFDWVNVEPSDLSALYGEADCRLLHQRAHDKRLRAATWTRNMSAAGDPTCRQACQYIRGASIQPLSAVVLNGHPETAIPVLDQHLIDYWSHVGGEEIQDMECAEEYANLWCPQLPGITLPLITADDILYVWKHTRARTSPGFGGWTSSMLKSLPRAAANEMAQLFNLMEHLQYSPEGLRRALVALIPKREGPVLPSATRPISVLPTLARTWSATRSSHLQARMAEFLAPQQHGGIPNRSAQQPVSELLSLISKTEMEGRTMYGIQVDFAKFFDSASLPFICHLLRRAGLDDQWVHFVEKHYGRITRHFRYTNGRLGQGWRPDKGLLQGDALSVALANVCVSPLAHHLQWLQSVHPGMWSSFFVDDLIVVADTYEALSEAINAIETFLMIANMQVNPSKCVYFGLGSLPSCIPFGQTTLPRCDHIQYLGYSISFSSRGDQEVQQAMVQTWEKVLHQLRRAAWLPCGTARRAQLVGMGPMAKWTYNITEATFDRRNVVGQRKAVLRSVRGQKSVLPSAAPEVALSFMAPLHRVDPPMARGMQLLKMVRMMTNTLPDLHPVDLDKLPRRGPLYALATFCEWAGITFHYPQLQCGHIQVTLTQYPQDHRRWLHEVRALMRHSQECLLEGRRPQTFQGLSAGLCRVRFFHWINSTWTPRQKGLAWLAQTGSLLTGDRECRYRLRSSAVCPHCQASKEDLSHILLTCPRWALQRRDHWRDVPTLTANTLLVPATVVRPPREVHSWFAQCLDILERWFTVNTEMKNAGLIPGKACTRSLRPTKPMIGTTWDYRGHHFEFVEKLACLRMQCHKCGACPKYSERFKILARECPQQSPQAQRLATRRSKFLRQCPSLVIQDDDEAAFIRCKLCNATWKKHGSFTRAKQHASVCRAEA